jgi:hypothetical protein
MMVVCLCCVTAYDDSGCDIVNFALGVTAADFDSFDSCQRVRQQRVGGVVYGNVVYSSDGVSE